MKKTENQNREILDAITPIELNFGRNRFGIGEMLAKAYGIIRYTPSVHLGWLAQLTNLGSCLISITYTPNTDSELINAISRNIAQQRGEAMGTRDYIKQQRAETGVANAEEIIRKVDRDGETIGRFSLVIMPFGTTEKELITASKEMESRIAALGFSARCLSNLQMEAYEQLSPFHAGNAKIDGITETIMPLSTLVHGEPWSAVDFSDNEGFYFGRDAQGGVIFLNMWLRQNDRTNSNWVVLGEPGQGKSFLVKHIITEEFALSGAKIIIIDPEREYVDMVKKLGGDVINCGGSDKGKINPLQVKHYPKDDDDGGLNDLALHLKNVECFFDMYLPDLTSAEKAALNNAVIDVYASFNIDFDTDASTLSSTDFPIMSDIYNYLSKKKDTLSVSLANKLKSIAEGADKYLWNGHTNIKSDNQLICLNTHNLQDTSDTTKKTQYYNVLTWAWEQASKDRKEKCIIVCDESYLMIDERVPQALTFLRNLAKRGRKYNVSLMVISHSVVDFLSPEIKRYGQEILGNATYKVFFGCDGRSEQELAELYNLNTAEQDFILSKRKANGLVSIGSKRIRVNFDLGYKSDFLTGGGL